MSANSLELGLIEQASSQSSLLEVNDGMSLKQPDSNRILLQTKNHEASAFGVLTERAQSQETLLRKRGRKPEYKGAEHPELIDRAKLILPQHDYDVDALLELDEFKRLRNSKDLTRFISKYVLNQTCKNHAKSVVGHLSQKLEAKPKVILDMSQLPQAYIPFQKPSIQGSSAQASVTPQANYGAKISSEVTSNYLREYMLIRPTERYSFLESMCKRNSQSLLEFLMNLKSTSSSNFCDGMFSLVHELNVNMDLDLQLKTRLFVQSLLFYRDEQVLIDEDLLKNSMNLLGVRPNSEQTLGLANYIFINEIEAFSRESDSMALLDSKNIGIIPLMIGTFASHKIDPQVIRMLPNTLQCLNKPFIQLLKQDHGLRLIREIPISLVGDFVQICALCQARTFKDLDEMVVAISSIFIKYWDYLDQADFSLLISQLSVELKERNPNWVSKTQEIINIAEQVRVAQVEKCIRNRPDLIADLINGNQSKLKQLMRNPKSVEELTGQQYYKMIGKFKKMNRGNPKVEQFCNDIQENKTKQCGHLGEVEEALGFKLMPLQRLCLNFILWEKASHSFVNFGIGNGKTLLCTVIALISVIDRQCAAFIVGKSDYLVLRDEKRFQALAKKFHIDTYYNQVEGGKGLYFLTQPYFDQLKVDRRAKKILQCSILVLDEYDWMVFEGQPNKMLEQFVFLRRACKVYGFTGSTISQKEESCLDLAFQRGEVKFPSLSALTCDRKVHLPDVLMNTSQQDYCKQIYELAMKQTLQTPVIIVAAGAYSQIEAYFKKFRELEFFSMKGVKGSRVDAQLEGKFNVKNNTKRYGVYLLSEMQGRGTDLPSSKDIESNGGLYLIIADILSKRSTIQVVGRVGRLDKKGQWRHFLLITGSQDTVEQAIQCRQEFLENELNIKFSKLQSALQSRWPEDKRALGYLEELTSCSGESDIEEEEEEEKRQVNGDAILVDKHLPLLLPQELQEPPLSPNLTSVQSPPSQASAADTRSACGAQMIAQTQEQPHISLSNQGEQQLEEEEKLTQPEQPATRRKRDAKVYSKRQTKKQVRDSQMACIQPAGESKIQETKIIALEPRSSQIQQSNKGTNLLKKRVTRARNSSEIT